MQNPVVAKLQVTMISCPMECPSWHGIAYDRRGVETDGAIDRKSALFHGKYICHHFMIIGMLNLYNENYCVISLQDRRR